MRVHVFALLGLSILLSAVVGGVAFHLSGGSTWHRDTQRVQAYVGNRFAEVWDHPHRRDDFASTLATELELGVELVNPEGTKLGAFGSACRGPSWSVPVRRGPAVIGTVELCSTSQRGPAGPIVAVIAVCVVLWGFSGLWARRLLIPVERAATVARKLGSGDLSARVDIPRRGPPEVRELGQTINDMADRIEKQIRDQRELLAAVSHEMRTPMTRLRIITELVRDGRVDEKTLRNMEAEIAELDGLVGQLLASSRLDFGTLQRRLLNVRDTVLEAMDRAGIPEERLVDRCSGASFEVDPTLIARALANLFDNASKHGNGVTEVRIECDEDEVVMSVSDAGPGFPEGSLDRVFEAFYRPDGASAEASSLGLGLALVHRIATAHGGTACARNRSPGAVVRFSVRRKRQGESDLA